MAFVSVSLVMHALAQWTSRRLYNKYVYMHFCRDGVKRTVAVYIAIDNVTAAWLPACRAPLCSALSLWLALLVAQIQMQHKLRSAQVSS